ncbi:MAG: hypothetical protein GY718_17185 [Lentisphaerae bacterium]|nr:hypothetical protein [Lentisphaerota bacterium]
MGLEKDKEDIDARIEFLKKCIIKAYKKADRNKQCLKIFAIPEFFFRGKHGAYPIELSEYLISKLKDLTRGGTSGLDYLLDWLFVFGTAVFYSADKQSNKEVYNVCIIHSGGPALQKFYKPPLQNKTIPIENDTFIVMKDLISNSDFFEEVKHMPAVSPPALAKNEKI